jgi:hypothetical protein
LATFYTKAFEQQLLDLGEDPEDWADYFQSWTELSEDGKLSDEFFGRDTAYVKPHVGGKPYVLRHVHLKPFQDAALKKWMSLHYFRSIKTSDRILVYASRGNGDHLLIFILADSAHEIQRMRTKQDKETMEGFAIVAETFNFNGAIIA